MPVTTTSYLLATAKLVLALVQAESPAAIVSTTRSQLLAQPNIAACELILASPAVPVASPHRTLAPATLKANYAEVFRLQRSHCGPPAAAQLRELFPAPKTPPIHSTALCPIFLDEQHTVPLALLALGNPEPDHFTVQSDTLFLDFIGRLVGVALLKSLASEPEQPTGKSS